MSWARFCDSNPNRVQNPLNESFSKEGFDLIMTAGAASAVQKQRPSLEDEVFRLKLEWMMAKTEEDKRKISNELREKIGLSQQKQ